jgi:hypothetical protein
MSMPSFGGLAQETIVVHGAPVDKKRPYLRGTVDVTAPTPDTMLITARDFYVQSPSGCEALKRSQVGMIHYSDGTRHYGFAERPSSRHLPPRVSLCGVVVDFSTRTGTVIAQASPDHEVEVFGPVDLRDRENDKATLPEMVFGIADGVSQAVIATLDSRRRPPSSNSSPRTMLG